MDVPEESVDQDTIKVITFNCLSPFLVNNDWFPSIKKHHLDGLHRFNLFKKKMRSFMRAKYIICLQELCSDWHSAISETFTSNGYHIVYRHYMGGTMGVAIAYPVDSYGLVLEDSWVPHTQIERRNYIVRNNTESETLKLSTNTVSREISSTGHVDNVQLTLVLRMFDPENRSDKKKEVIVSTYHMPCKFQKEHYMMCQVLEIKEHLKNLHVAINDSENVLARSIRSSTFDFPECCRVILTGDMNIIPQNSAYNLLVDSSVDDEKMKAVYDFYTDASFETISFLKFSSAFEVANEEEPDYTNVKISPSGEYLFMDCIDYILVSEGTKVMSSVVGLTPKHGENPVFPNAICPSDHIPLSASLIIG